MATCQAPAAGKVLAEPELAESAISLAAGMSSATNASASVLTSYCRSRGSTRPGFRAHEVSVAVDLLTDGCFAKFSHGAPNRLFPFRCWESRADADSAEERGEVPEKRPGQASASLVSWSVSMSTRQQRVITTKVFRAGETPPEDDWIGSSVAERIDAVWELTRQCLAWNQTGTDEPRLQRSVSRVQRPSR
jgi:hypothetical protein